MAKPTDTKRVGITNTAEGPRTVNTVDGPLAIPSKQSRNATCTLGELADLDEMDHFDIGKPAAEEAAAEPAADPKDDGKGDGDKTPVIPDDLADKDQQDGIIVKKDLVAKAEAEGVEFQKTEPKADIVAKIVAKRAETAQQ